MESIVNLINKRASEILSNTGQTELDTIQAEIDRFYPEDVKAVKVYEDRNLLLEVANSSLASDIYMRQREILKAINGSLQKKVSQLRTKVK